MKNYYTSSQASKYVKFISNSFSWNFIEKPAIQKYLKPYLTKSTKVLDAGCGTGQSTKFLISLGVKERNTLGVDISEDMLSFARRFLPKVKFVKESLPVLELKNDSLDLIVSVMVFHFLNKSEYEKMINNFYKMLNDGGILFFITLHPLRFVHDHNNYFDGKLKREKTPWGTDIEYEHRTITDYLMPIINSGFELKLVEELRPINKNIRDQVQLEKYSSVPTRLAVMAVKK